MGLANNLSDITLETWQNIGLLKNNHILKFTKYELDVIIMVGNPNPESVQFLDNFRIQNPNPESVILIADSDF